eukprot:snap_masked-scaffold_7-processed-gene-16.27-mRNA-1 protein AED:1.00 eAED:1.00 QI:0/-1/0/0/-1/1/1/0/80
MEGETMSFRTRHLGAKHFYSRILLKKCGWKIHFIRGSKNVADVFTKPVSKTVFNKSIKLLTWETGEEEERRNGENISFNT